MNGPDTAIVEYNWKYVPNALGDVFDASGSLVKGFNLWERQTLINKYAVAFYHGDPTKSRWLSCATAGNGNSRDSGRWARVLFAVCPQEPPENSGKHHPEPQKTRPLRDFSLGGA